MIERLAGGPDLPALLPSTLLSDSSRRTPRDWFVDTTFFLFSLGVVALLSATASQRAEATWVVVVDIALGVLSALALWFRRRWPVAITLALVPVGMFAITSAPAAIIMIFTVAVHRPVRISAPLAAAHAAVSLVYYAWRPDPDLSYGVNVLIGSVFTFAILAWGMFIRARRQLVLSLRERAQRAEEEQQLRIAQARQLERARIAREMHDVLAHRISLLSLHAGALEFRTDIPADEVSKAVGVIRSSAHQALQDLRQVIGVLRDEGGSDEPPRPQPTLADLPGLVEESRAAGMRVRLEPAVDGWAAVPEVVGRNAYRIVQEGLTNARKHAAGAVVDVRIAGRAGDGLTVSVRNPFPVGGGRASEIPGTGTGIVGLAERAGLAGGRLEHGRVADGDFELKAWLPWPAS
jgi:signal transduction histidine kinase